MVRNKPEDIQFLRILQSHLVEKYTSKPLTSGTIDKIQREVSNFLLLNNIKDSVKLKIYDGKFDYMEIVRAKPY